MAVAGLHNVPSAFGPSFFDDSRPVSRASSLLQMWKELENEHAMGTQSCNSSRPNRKTINGSDTECSSTPMSENGYSNEFECEENNSVLSEDLGETERVRQIFQEWMRSGSKGNPSQVFRLNNLSDDQGSVAIRPIRKLCGRQTLLDLLLRSQSERKRELLCLDERRPVSEFVHRSRIQALLRGRFLRNEKIILDERPSSRAATELGLLRLRPTVSDLREGFLSKLDNSASNSPKNAELNSSCSHGSNVESESTFKVEEEASEIHKASNSESENTNMQTEANNQFMSSAWSAQDLTIANEPEEVIYNTHHEVTDENYEESDSVDASAQVERFHNSEMEIESDDSRDEEERGSAYSEPFDNNNVEEQEDQILESCVDWTSHELQEAIDSWLDIIPSGIRIDTFYPLNDDNDDSARNMELRDLFSRRRVSGLLGSGFRESLNQVLQSHVKRLARASDDREPGEFLSLTEGDQEQINGSEETSVLSDGGAERIPYMVPSTLWDAEFHHNSDYIMQLEMEWQLINELRIDMARLHQRMNNMQSMLEACMEMQIELQSSVLQEVSAALNRPAFSRDEEAKDASDDDNQFHDETNLDQVRKGICCCCGDSRIDSLLYRCGHMCTCSKCADNLVSCKGKCPMCRAPVVETVQAYFIQQ